MNVVVYYYGVILAWRLALGRYFVFRDMPQWFVEIMAADYWGEASDWAARDFLAASRGKNGILPAVVL